MRISVKFPKGTKDFHPADVVIRDYVVEKITSVFQKHGGECIDTPTFERRELLTNKYGEDQKLIYNMEDQGGEILSLRYDLTVPFARYMALTKRQHMKRYQIGKVFRRDQPYMTKGRYREFVQCDFDIAGQHGSMLPDSEILYMMTEILNGLNLKYMIKLNHRKLLDGLFEFCGVAADKIRPISSAIDKLDKSPWEEVKKELIQKGCTEEVAEKIGQYVSINGNEAIEDLMKDSIFSNGDAKVGLTELKTLFEYCKAYKILDNVCFDMSLARGLDYYTGPIFEAILLDHPIGTISAGGRYDELVGAFSGKKIPCVGFSIGVDRLCSIFEEAPKTKHTKVLVVGMGSGCLESRLSILAELWNENIEAETAFKPKPKMQAQFDICDKELIPIAIMVGDDEVKNGTVGIKDMRLGGKGQVTVPHSMMIKTVKEWLLDINELSDLLKIKENNK
eukprot:NODE_663_length_5420_cov_0.347679.p1 type:complete len:449 gc:universal NODE_663_length_5420_cov_0.347679:3771-2425(-)